MMKFSKEEYSDVLVAEMMPLLEQHHAEIEAFPGAKFEPRIALYETIAQQGKLRIFTVRVGGLLAGYQVFMVDNHPHSQNSRQALQDIIFLAKPYRKGLAGYRFIGWCDDQLRAEGINVSIRGINAKHDFGPVLERLGYELTDLVFTRSL